MNKILVDIREENETIRKYFKNKDLVSVDELLDTIDNLIYEKKQLEYELEEERYITKAEENDPYKEWRDING